MYEMKKVHEYDERKDYLANTEDAKKASDLISGDDRMKSLRYWLDNLGIKRHKNQIRFHDEMIKASLTKIYETEWPTQHVSIMKKYGVEEKMKREMLFTCPRRFGKTWAVGSFCAAYLLSVQNCTIAVFAAGKKTAKKLMVLILKFLQHYPNIEERITISNQDDLVLEFSKFDERRTTCYACAIAVRFSFLFSLRYLLVLLFFFVIPGISASKVRKRLRSLKSNG